VGINKNGKMLKNKALLIDLFMVIITIIIPTWFAKTNIETNLFAVFIMICLFIFFYYINHNTHKLYLQNIENTDKDEQEKEKIIGSKRNIIIKYSIYLVLTGIALFFVGNLLSGTLENLCNRFKVPEIVLGIALGFITSIPELITFFEAQKHHKSKENEFLGIVEATNNLLASNTLNLFVIHSIGIILYRIFW
jgi:Ca2+/H+ antiporter